MTIKIRSIYLNYSKLVVSRYTKQLHTFQVKLSGFTLESFQHHCDKIDLVAIRFGVVSLLILEQVSKSTNSIEFIRLSLFENKTAL